MVNKLIAWLIFRTDLPYLECTAISSERRTKFCDKAIWLVRAGFSVVLPSLETAVIADWFFQSSRDPFPYFGLEIQGSLKIASKVWWILLLLLLTTSASPRAFSQPGKQYLPTPVISLSKTNSERLWGCCDDWARAHRRFMPKLLQGISKRWPPGCVK